MCFLQTSLFVCVFVFHTKIMELIWHVHFVQAAGKYKQKGRDYIVEDGDIILFKFNAGAGLSGKKKWCQGENGSCASRHWPFITSVLSVATCDVTLHACSKSKGRVCLLKDIECHQKEQNVIWEWKQHFEKQSQSLSLACLPRLQCKHSPVMLIKYFDIIFILHLNRVIFFYLPIFMKQIHFTVPAFATVPPLKLNPLHLANRQKCVIL